MSTKAPVAGQDLSERLAKLFHGMAEPSRLRILYSLADGPLSVSQIARRTGLTQPNTSNHLSCMLGCGLVVSERKGRFVFYRHTDEHVSMLLTVADQIVSGRPARSEAEEADS